MLSSLWLSLPQTPSLWEWHVRSVYVEFQWNVIRSHSLGQHGQLFQISFEFVVRLPWDFMFFWGGCSHHSTLSQLQRSRCEVRDVTWRCPLARGASSPPPPGGPHVSVQLSSMSLVHIVLSSVQNMKQNVTKGCCPQEAYNLPNIPNNCTNRKQI